MSITSPHSQNPSYLAVVSENAFPYSQPPLVELLILLSFLYLLNVVRVGADHFLHAGVVAMIALGTIYGTPLAAILPQDWESTFTAIGYLGLVGIVFEGGLSTNLTLLLSNLPLSLLCASIGVALPIALSFVLLTGAYGYAPLESFAAGAALASTSLGTTLMALNSVTRTGNNIGSASKEHLPLHEHTSGVQELSDVPHQAKDETLRPSESRSLQQSRIGTILISAAVIDDVIGLVLAAMIPALSALNTDVPHSNLAWTIIRPLLSSMLMTIVTPLVARYVLRPLFWYRRIGERWCSPSRTDKPWGAKIIFGCSSENAKSEGWGVQVHADAIRVLFMVLFVSAFAAIAFYTSSSILFGVYLAGCVLSYIAQPPQESHANEHETQSVTEALSFEGAFSRMVGPIQQYLMTPLFFASIGFAIPFVALWDPKVLWRGTLYSLAMGAGKLAAGIPIIVTTMVARDTAQIQQNKKSFIPRIHHTLLRLVQKSNTRTLQPTANLELSLHPTTPSLAVPDSAATKVQPTLAQRFESSLVPAFFMGSAMVARGEIGLLIAQIAKNGSEHGSSEEGLLSDEAFLVCIWAILLCTLVGPISVGFVIRWWGPRVSSGIWR